MRGREFIFSSSKTRSVPFARALSKIADNDESLFLASRGDSEPPAVRRGQAGC